MSFQIVRNDITKVKADAIVNTANPLPQIGSGTDSAIYIAAGTDKLLKARQEIGIIDRGQSAYTPAFDLTEKNGVKYIIHTVGILYENGEGRCTVGIWFKPLADDVAHSISKKFQLYKG